MVVVEATASAFGSRDILHGTQACADILAVIVGSVPVGLRLRWCVAIRADARTAQVCSIELEAGVEAEEAQEEEGWAVATPSSISR